MKKFIYVALMTFVLIGMGSCSKNKDLTGTKWVASITETDEGETYSFTMTLEFTTKTEGTVSISFFGMSESDPFTYTYDGDGSGTITTTDEGESYTVPFTVDGDELTMTDEGQTIVFTKQ